MRYLRLVKYFMLSSAQADLAYEALARIDDE